MADIDLRERVVRLALLTVKDLYELHDITDPSQAKRLARERFTQAELDRYTAARDVLDGMGVLG